MANHRPRVANVDFDVTVFEVLGRKTAAHADVRMLVEIAVPVTTTREALMSRPLSLMAEAIVEDLEALGWTSPSRTRELESVVEELFQRVRELESA